MKNKNKFALVTGASTGIGRALAIEIGKLAWTVGLVARDLEKLEETKRQVEKVGGNAVTFPTDLTDTESINNLVSLVSIEAGQIDLIANIAGIWHGKDSVYAGKDLSEIGLEINKDTYMVGSVAPTILSGELVRLMPSGASIVNLSGTFENGGKGWIPYYVSKRAIEDLTVGLADEFREKGIKVNCVSPSDTATEEYKRFFPEDAENAQSPEEVAKFIVSLLDKDVTGRVFVIKNGKVSEGFHK